MSPPALPRICFVGYGQMAGRHARLLRKLYPRIELSFAGPDPAKAEQARAAWGGRTAFESVEQAAASSEVDILFIVTPHARHAELAVLGAGCGKDLIIEKPITRTLAELAAVERAVAEHGVRCTVAENYYYKPALGRIGDFVAQGLIGRPLLVQLTKTTRQAVSGWRTDAELMGGGALLEGGVHWVDALLSVAGGRPLRAVALKPRVDYQTEVPFEDTLVVSVQFDNGCVGTLTHSWKIPNRFFGLGLSKVHGTEGVITFESNGLFVSVWGRKKRFRLFSPRRFLGFRDMLRAFVEDHRQGRPWQPDLARIRAEMEVIDAAYRSLESGRLEEVSTREAQG